MSKPNVMHYFKILPGAAPPIEHPVWIEKIASISSEQSGIFYPLVRRGTYVAAGMEVGRVTDYFGQTIYVASRGRYCPTHLCRPFDETGGRYRRHRRRRRDSTVAASHLRLPRWGPPLSSAFQSLCRVRLWRISDNFQTTALRFSKREQVRGACYRR